MHKRLSGLGQSKCCEDAVNIARHLEGGVPNASQGHPTSVWKALLDRGLCDRVYHYDAPKWQDTVAPTGVAAELRGDLYQPRWGKCPKWVRGIMGASSRPTWFAPGAASQNILYAELLLMHEAHQNGNWKEIADGAQLPMLFQAPNLVVSPPGSDEWFLALGDIGFCAGVVWPCTFVVLKGKAVGFDPMLSGEPKVLLMYSPQWRACTVEWLSPLPQVLHGAWPSVAGGMKLKCRVVTGPGPILEEAAHNAFWSLNQSALRWVGRFIGLKIESSASTFNILEGLLGKLAPSLKGEASLNILSGRMRANNVFDDIFSCEDAADLVDDQDRDELATAVRKATSEREATQSCLTEWVAKRSAIRKKGGKSRNKSKDGHKKSFKNVAGAEIKRFMFPKSRITKEIAMRICPRPVHIYEDEANSRWQVFWKGVGRRSRSWFMYRHFGAAKLVLQWAWKEVLAREGLSTAAPVASGSASSRSGPK